MKTIVRIFAVLFAFAAFALLGLFTGCASMGRTGASIAKLVAPEYAATADNLFSMLQDDQVFDANKIVVAVETPDGRRWNASEIKVVARGEDAWMLDRAPAGVMRRLYGTKAPASDLDAAKAALADALKSKKE